MKLKTLFRAYQITEAVKRVCASSAPTTWGIGVNKDKWSLRWQRYNRLSRKLEERILDYEEKHETLTRDLLTELRDFFVRSEWVVTCLAWQKLKKLYGIRRMQRWKKQS
jgi:hypothetical protein